MLSIHVFMRLENIRIPIHCEACTTPAMFGDYLPVFLLRDSLRCYDNL